MTFLKRCAILCATGIFAPYMEIAMSRTLTKADIVEALYRDGDWDMNRADVKNVVEEMLALMKKAIVTDGALLLSGFGKFEAYGKNARKGRNPRTAEALMLPARKVVVFRLSRRFKLALNKDSD